MATYIVLSNFTDQGIRGVKETVNRADTVRDMARRFGISVREIYWTMGNYDVVALFDSPDEQSITAMALALGQAGNVRTQILRAFNREEMKTVLGKLTQREAIPA